MPGDYLFPKRKLRAIGDVLDPTELNQNILPAAERLNGQLNQHNIKAPLDNSVKLTSDLFMTPYSAVQYATSGLSYTSAPTSASGDIFALYGESSWRLVSGASVTVPTGTSMLAMWATAWYCYQFADSSLTFHDPSGAGSTATRWAYSADSGTGNAFARYYRAAIQFALRIDGTVIQETMTGRVDTEQAPFFPYRVTAPRLREDRNGTGTSTGDVWSGDPTAGNAPNPDSTASPKVGGRVGPQSRRLPRTPHGVNYTCCPIRIGYTILTEPGAHTIELVARRIANRHTQSTFISKVNVYSRQLVVFDNPLEQVNTTTSLASPVNIPELQPEDVLSAAAIEVDRISPIETSSNSIEAAQLARGALNSDHMGNRRTILKSIRRVAGDMANTGSLSPDAAVNRTSEFQLRSDYNMLWQGFSSLAPAKSLDSAYDGSLKQITLATGSAPRAVVRSSVSTTDSLFTNSTDKMHLMVLANVELRYLAAPNLRHAAASPESFKFHAQAFAGFGIAIRFVGDASNFYYLYDSSEAIVNCANYYDADEDEDNEAMVNVSTQYKPVMPEPPGIIRDHGNVHVDVPLMAFFDLSGDRAGTTDIADIAVIGGVNGEILTNSGLLSATLPRNRIEARVNRASIFAFAVAAGGS